MKLKERRKMSSQPYTPEQDKMLKEKMKKYPMMKVQSTPPIKLKDKAGRGGVKFNLLRDFGFVPVEIVIQKVAGRNNTIVVSAVVPEGVLQKENDKPAGQESKTVDKGSSKADS